MNLRQLKNSSMPLSGFRFPVSGFQFHFFGCGLRPFVMNLPQSLRALRHRDFRLFWAGQLVSLVGSWMQAVGQAWLVLTLTGSAFKLGLISALQWGPMLVLAFVGGAVADRLPKRRLILATQITFMLQAFVLAALVASGQVRFWHVAVLAGIYGVAATVDMPTRQSFIVEMVGKDDLLNAVALNSMIFNGARLVGPALAGLLVDRYGIALAFALNGISFAGVIAALLAMKTEGRPAGPGTGSMGQQIRAGLSYARTTPRVRLILALLLAASVFLVNHNVLVPLLAKSVLGLGAHGFGLLMSFLGAGALAGAAGMAVIGKQRPPLWLVGASAVVMALAILALGFVSGFAPAAGALTLAGIAQILFLTSCNTTLQLTVPNELRGRIMSLYTLVFAGVTPIGSFLAGAVAEAAGVPAAFIVGGTVGLAWIAALLWRVGHRPEQPPVSPSSGDAVPSLDSSQSSAKL